MKLEDLKKGEITPCNETTVNEEMPKWLDMDKFQRGQQFFQKHLVVATFAMHCSLLVGFSLVNLLEALVFTGKSDTPGKSIKRYLETFFHVYQWHIGNVWTDPNDPAYKSLRQVRKMHFKVAKDLEEKYTKEEADRKTSPKEESQCFQDVKKNQSEITRVHLNQYDMGLVQVGFFGAITMYPSGFGIVTSKEELEDYIHFWRGIGYILGIKDEYNICKGNYQESFDICKDIEENVLMRGLEDPAQDFHQMAKAYCDGVNSLTGFSFYTREALTAFVMDGMSRDPKLQILSWPDWFRFWGYKLFMCMIRWLPGFETFLNRRAARNFEAILKVKASDREKGLHTLACKIDGKTVKCD